MPYAEAVRDTARQPIFNVPFAVLALVASMAAIQALQGVLSDAHDAAILVHFAFVPGRLTAAIDPAAVLGRLASLQMSDPGPDGGVDAARFFLGTGTPHPWTALTYAMLHGGWTHLGLNAVWLLAFGAPVARRLRPVRFLLLFVAGSLAGAATHFAVDPLSLQPLVGASAAVSAFMGAALRFVFQPASRGWAGPIEHAPRLSLLSVLRDRRAAAFLIVWFLSNLVTGVAAVPMGLSDMPIAWQAHVGGFLMGLLAFPLFDPAADGPVAPAPPVEPAAEADV